MKSLKARLEALERQHEARTSPHPQVTIWQQDPAGADAFTCSQRPGEVLTSVELDELPKGGPGFSIIVVRGASDE